MNKFILYFVVLFHMVAILGCKKIQNEQKEIDNKSYINDFELSQKNSLNETLVKITSPKAVIDANSNDIEIFDNLIKIIDKDGEDDIEVKSNNSILNNSSNLIRVFNNVNISLVTNENYYVTTESFIWDLNSSHINLNSPLYINLDNTNIRSSSGSYNINSNLLKINNNIFKRKIISSEGKEKYQIEVSSDIAKWFKKENILEFTSNNKQVETTIKFLTVK